MALEDIAGYSLRRGFGSGSVGAVWLVRDLASGRHAVLKRIPKSAIPMPNDFRDDLARARSIDHPHVARLLEVRQTDREWLLFSQYVAAGTLTALLQRRGPLSLGELVTLITPLAEGLAALHSADLTHTRLSSDNIMFDADGRPVITDPGLRLDAPDTPADDLNALGDLAIQSGADPKLFPPTLFTTPGDDIAQYLLALTPPTPIDLGFTPTSSRSATTGAATTSRTTAHPTVPAPDNPASSSSDDDDTADQEPVDQRSTSQQPVDQQSTNQQSTDQAAQVQQFPDNEAGGERAAAERRGRLGFVAEPITAGSNTVGPTSPCLTSAESAGPGSAAGSTERGLARLRVSDFGSTRAGPVGSGRVDGTVGSARTERAGRGAARGGAVRRTRAARGGGRSTGNVGSRGRKGVARVREGLQARRSAFGILAACGVAALIVLAIGLATVGMLGRPATGSKATAGTQPSSSPSTPAVTSSPSTSPQNKSPSASPTAGQATRAADAERWLRMLQSLDRRRSQAFSSLNPAELDAIYVPGSPPWRSDHSLLAAYRKQQVRVEGLRMQIETLIVEHPGDETVVLRIVDRLIAGAAVTRSGQRTPFPPGPPTTRRITLISTNTSWRISAITIT